MNSTSQPMSPYVVHHQSVVSEIGLDVTGLFSIIRRNLFGIVISFMLALEFAAILFIYLPRSYEAKSVINIESSYFKNPLVKDLVSEASDMEFQARREALVQMALSEQFLERLGEDLGIFQSAPGTMQREQELDDFRRQFEFFPFGNSNMHVITKSDSADLTYEMLDRAVSQIVTTVLATRFEMLNQAREAIQAQVQFLGNTLNDLGSVREVAELRKESKELEHRIAELRVKYTEFHPELLKAQEEAEVVKGKLRRLPDAAGVFEKDEIARAFAFSKNDTPIENVYQDLLQKLSYLNVVLSMEEGQDHPLYLSILEQPEMPRQASFPTLPLLLAFGLALGGLASLMQVVYFEMKRREVMSPKEVSALLGAPSLGILPSTKKDETPLLEGRARLRALPEST